MDDEWDLGNTETHHQMDVNQDQSTGKIVNILITREFKKAVKQSKTAL